MNVALVFPPSTFLTDAAVWPPLGLFYLASQIQAQGHGVDFYDMSFSTLPGRLQDGDYDQVWISATSPQMYAVRKLGEQMRPWEKTVTILGGAAVWADPALVRDLPFDLMVVGEGDHPDTVSRLLATRKQPPSKLLYTPLAPDLNWVLPPERKWSRDYHAFMRGKRMASLFTTRGCAMSCAFCESGRLGVIWDGRVRYEPVAVVEAQMRQIKDLGFDGLAYYDDIFILNRKRTLELLELHRKYGLVFRCFLRSDILCKHGGRDYLQALVEGGLIECFIGVESASNQIKQNIHKGTTIEQDELALRWCKELGVTCKMSFILGLPGETLETMAQTRSWILAQRPHIAQVDRLIPFPGTPLTKHPQAYDLTYAQVPEEEWFFRGRYDLGSKSFVSTTQLSVAQIDAFWHALEQELIQEGLAGYGH